MSTDALASALQSALYAQVVFVRQPVRAGHGFGVVYGIDSEISKATVVFFVDSDDAECPISWRRTRAPLASEAVVVL